MISGFELYTSSSIRVYLACLLVCMGLTTYLCAIWMGFILTLEDAEVTIRRSLFGGELVLLILLLYELNRICCS